MSADHEYCEHGICLKCEPCELCAAAKEGKKYAAEALRLMRLAGAARPTEGEGK